METKIQPHSVEAEMVVISSILQDGEKCYDEVSQIIDSSDFYNTKYAIFFDTFGKMVEAGKEIDEISVLEQIRKDGTEEDLGGLAAIYEIESFVETSLTAMTRARDILEKSKLRKIIRASRQACEEAYEMQTDPGVISSKLEDNIQKITDVGIEGSGAIASATIELREDIKAMMSGTYVTKSLPTGIAQIDEKLSTGGIGNGEVMVLSAPTSCGKTQLALCIALRAAVSNSEAGLYFSFEMPAKQLSKRIVQTVSAVNLKKAADGVMSSNEQKRVWDALEKVEKSPIYTEHYVRNVAELRAKARTYKRKYGIKWIVIDYLQLVPFDGRMKKNDAIAEISHQIKLMAMELDLPVILLAQVNREGAKRETGLTLYDLKDSGDIENDADVILLMWPDGADVDEARRIDGDGRPYVSLKYNIAKQREGDRDQKGKLKFINQHGRFH